MAQGGFDGPDFRRRKDAGKRRILPEALRLIRLGTQQPANVFNRPGQNDLPLRIATQQRRRGGILARPARKVGAGQVNQSGLPTQPFRHPPCQGQTRPINVRMLHLKQLNFLRVEYPPAGRGMQVRWPRGGLMARSAKRQAHGGKRNRMTDDEHFKSQNAEKLKCCPVKYKIRFQRPRLVKCRSQFHGPGKSSN